MKYGQLGVQILLYGIGLQMGWGGRGALQIQNLLFIIYLVHKGRRIPQ